MSYRHFVVVFDSLPIDRHQVKSGENSPEIITGCRCVNVGLFLSNDMRRDTEVTLAIVEEEVCRAITFPGKDLRRVSPDERSISFFILKASELLDSLEEGEQKKLDNGIQITKSSIIELIQTWDNHQIYRADSRVQDSLNELNDKTEGVFIFELRQGMLDESMKNIPSINVQKPSTPERFILDINYQLDSK